MSKPEKSVVSEGKLFRILTFWLKKVTSLTMTVNSSRVMLLLQAFVGEWRVDASATLKLQMVSYANPESKDYGGSCCDVWCWSDCDHYFRFSLDVGNRYAYV